MNPRPGIPFKIGLRVSLLTIAPVPGGPSAVGTDGHAMLDEPVGHRRAIERLLEDTEPLPEGLDGRDVLQPVVVRLGAGRLDVAERLARWWHRRTSRTGSSSLLDPFRRVRVVAHVVAAGRDHVLLPRALRGVDAVVGRQHPGAVVHRHPQSRDASVPRTIRPRSSATRKSSSRVRSIASVWAISGRPRASPLPMVAITGTRPGRRTARPRPAWRGPPGPRG